jgi:uncharacterized membrane protein YoaK (UPF0700 family)
LNRRSVKVFQLLIIFTLAFIGGYINVVSLLSNYNFTITHLTGNVSKLTEAYFFKDSIHFKSYIYILLFFLFGSATSGFIVGGSEFKFKKKYGYVLISQSIVLLFATFLLKSNIFLGILLAAYTCGLQNGLIIKFNGSLVRTTHLTGTITDLGVNIGNFCRTKFLDKWKFFLNIILIFGFFTGGFIALKVFNFYKVYSLIFIVILYLFMGISYEILKHRDNIQKHFLKL